MTQTNPPQGGQQPQQALKQQLQSVGVHDPAHEQAAQRLHGLGMPPQEILDGVRALGPEALDFAQRILDLIHGGGGTQAAQKQPKQP